MPRDGSATRSRILATALRMFVEQGYDKTSLREVADEVGVTKAALYYHFKTKDDIARAALAEFGTGFDDVARWLEAQPPGPERDEGFVDRLLRLFDSGGLLAIRFLQTNPAAVAVEHEDVAGGSMVRLMRALSGDAPTPRSQLRSLLAFLAMMVSAVGAEQFPLAGTPQERRDEARTIALELLAAAR